MTIPTHPDADVTLSVHFWHRTLPQIHRRHVTFPVPVGRRQTDVVSWGISFVVVFVENDVMSVSIQQ